MRRVSACADTKCLVHAGGQSAEGSPAAISIAGMLLALLLLHCNALACIWDSDTLADEQRGLPDMTAIIVGRYERHTRDFYLRRRNNAMRALKTATPAQAKLLMDDIAVANDKTNRGAIAIQTMHEKIKRFGIDYRTAANLGTFYAHSGDYKNAEIWIARAIKINPQAHFGREWVQLRAIRWMQIPQAERAPNLFGSEHPFWNKTVDEFNAPFGRDATSDDKQRIKLQLRASGVPDNALEATAALTKMGDRQSPELMMALAQLLAANGHTSLAAEAYWRADELGGASHPYHQYFQDAAAQLLHHIRGTKLGWWQKRRVARKAADAGLNAAPENVGQRDIVQDYIAQREYADRWMRAYQDYELALIDAGKDPENRASYAAFYKNWLPPQQAYIPPPQRDFSLWPLGAATVFSLALLRFWIKKKKKYA